MGEMAVDHGSELHLMRFMARHRQLLDETILRALQEEGGLRVGQVQWLDFPFDSRHKQKDSEWKSVDFLADAGGPAWRAFWPDPSPGVPERKGMPSWDAVARIDVNDSQEWLLVEAKAHRGELRNPNARCRAEGDSRKKIGRALKTVFQALVPENGPSWEEHASAWFGADYQKANRLACLHFLDQGGHRTRLLYVYFMGDRFPDAPTDEAGWRDAIDRQYSAMGLSGSKLDRVYEIFLDVCGGSGNTRGRS